MPLYRRADEPRLKILEPSAGTGSLARRLARPQASHGTYLHPHDVDCVEVQPDLANSLSREKIYRRVMIRDFLQIEPTPEYDLVVMNPPFDLERDIDHVMHALKFLKPDGELHAIMSAGTEFRETRKAVAFRKVIEDIRGKFSDLPPGSFSDVGTNVNTCILRIRKDGKQRYW